jgi:hypothetical protein
MANMSYCRFQNTYNDLYDCYNNINEQLSSSEHSYRQRLVAMCQSIIDEYDESCQDEEDFDDEE